MGAPVADVLMRPKVYIMRRHIKKERILTAQFVEYQYPANERLRQFLRLERLFLRIEHHLNLSAEFDSQAAVSLAVELYNSTLRDNIKYEIIKELERQQLVLASLQDDPYLNAQDLKILLTQLQELQEAVYDSDSQLTGNMHNDEMLSMITKRNFVAGGGGAFDLPVYHKWLQQPHSARKALLEYWLLPFAAIKAAMALLLHILRLCGVSEPAVAHGGYYEYSPKAGVPMQLIRVRLPIGSHCYPEIHAGHQYFNLRFFEVKNFSQRPQQCARDCPFDLTVCGL